MSSEEMWTVSSECGGKDSCKLSVRPGPDDCLSAYIFMDCRRRTSSRAPLILHTRTHPHGHTTSACPPDSDSCVLLYGEFY